MRKPAITFLLLAVVTLLSGCLTQAVLTTKPTYEDRIDAFYLGKDEDILIVVGENFTYRFSIDHYFRQAIEFSYVEPMQVRATTFRLVGEQLVGEVYLYVGTRNLDEEMVSLLRRQGFKKNLRFSQLGELYWSETLYGKPFVPDKSLQPTPMSEQMYVRIEKTDDLQSYLNKAATLPLVLAMDLTLLPLLIAPFQK